MPTGNAVRVPLTAKTTDRLMAIVNDGREYVETLEEEGEMRLDLAELVDRLYRQQVTLAAALLEVSAKLP